MFGTSKKDKRQPGVCYCLRLAIVLLFYSLFSTVRLIRCKPSLFSMLNFVLQLWSVKQNGNEKPGFEVSMPSMLRHNNDEASNSIYVFHGI